MLAVDSANRSSGNAKRAADPAFYDAWSDLISFVPPTSVQQEIKNRDPAWFFNRIDQAYGIGTNCDVYPVRIRALPTSFPTAADLFEHIRLNFRDFLALEISDFVPYDPIDKPRWESANPVGAVYTFDINLSPTWGSLTQFEDGSVVCSAHSHGEYWRFSTLHTTGDLDHPVSGTREWRIQSDGNDFVLYTRGADRVTGNRTGIFAEDVVFNGGDGLWRSFQAGVVNFVNNGGGDAWAETSGRNRPEWKTVQDLYHPTGSWL